MSGDRRGGGPPGNGDSSGDLPPSSPLTLLTCVDGRFLQCLLVEGVVGGFAPRGYPFLFGAGLCSGVAFVGDRAVRGVDWSFG